MPYKDPDYLSKYREKNKEQIKRDASKYREDNRQHAVESISSGTIVDKKKWNLWCNQIKGSAKQNNHPYSDDFTNDIIFDMMIKGCFYCGDVATTIDRVDSALDHTLDNCVGCCGPCNMSKGTSDSSTFIRKSYYMARGKYVDGVTNVWFINKTKPCMGHYKKNADKKKVSFELSKEKWNSLIKGDCEYCHRSPSTWFGIDRIVPENGYVDGNVVTCCFDCNLDKHVHDVKTTMARNEKISKRVDNGDLAIDEREHVILHKGTQKSSKKVCAYDKVYASQIEASRALKKSDNYISDCIYDGRYPKDIFYVSDDFYDFVVSNKLKNINKKMYMLFTRL